jgi:hypothetical protein
MCDVGNKPVLFRCLAVVYCIKQTGERSRTLAVRHYYAKQNTTNKSLKSRNFVYWI